MKTILSTATVALTFSIAAAANPVSPDSTIAAPEKSVNAGQLSASSVHIDQVELENSSDSRSLHKLSHDEVIQLISTELPDDVIHAMSTLINRAFIDKDDRPTAVIVGQDMGLNFAFLRGFGGHGKFLAKREGSAASEIHKIKWTTAGVQAGLGASVGRVLILVYGAQSPSDLVHHHFPGGELSIANLVGVSGQWAHSKAHGRQIDIEYIKAGVGVELSAGVSSYDFKIK